ncbi:MAG: TIR domain-containing protein [bacterium]|nr:TIR domain-containing protein [bacterium]
MSHNSRDKPAVRQLGEALKRRDLRAWLDEWELVPGRPWAETQDRPGAYLKDRSIW